MSNDDIPPVEYTPLLLGDKIEFSIPVGQCYELLVWYNAMKQQQVITGAPSMETLTDKIWEFITTPAYRAAINAVYHERMDASNPFKMLQGINLHPEQFKSDDDDNED